MSVLIKNGRIVTAESDYVADLYIQGEKISAIGKDLNLDAERVRSDMVLCQSAV